MAMPSAQEIQNAAKSEERSVAHEGLVNALAQRVATFGDDVRAHDGDPPPVYCGIPAGDAAG